MEILIWPQTHQSVEFTLVPSQENSTYYWRKFVNLLVYLTYFIVLWLQSLLFEHCCYSISCNLVTCVCYRCSDYVQLFFIICLITVHTWHPRIWDGTVWVTFLGKVNLTQHFGQYKYILLGRILFIHFDHCTGIPFG